MIKKYLEKRKEILCDIVRENKEKYDHNQIAINESFNQIKELEDMVDEATKIFSVKAREDNGFKNKEISDIQKRIAVYELENNEYQNNINEAQKELSIVNDCILDISNTSFEEDILQDVSRETFCNIEKKELSDIKTDVNGALEEKSYYNIEIINKLEFCKSIAEIDGKRVYIELDKIINMIKEWEFK